jgi:hypothetical protein
VLGEKQIAGNANIGNDQDFRLLQQNCSSLSVDNFDNDDVMRVFPNQPD